MGQKVKKVRGGGPNRVRMLLARGSLDISGDLEETVVWRPGRSPILSQWFPDFAAIGGAIKTPMPRLHTIPIRSECRGGHQEPGVSEDPS